MSTHLRTDLHRAIDGGGDASPFTSDDLVGRIRRRRAVRTGTRAAVGVGAAGAVALATTTLGQPDRSPAAPAGSPTGGFGGCGLDVETYAAAHPDTTYTLVGPGDAVAALDAFAAGGDQQLGSTLGRFGGRTLELLALTTASGGHSSDVPSARLLLASDGVVVGWAQTNDLAPDSANISWWTTAMRQSDLWDGDVSVTGSSVATAVESCDGGTPAPGTYALYAAPGVLRPDQSLLDVAGPWQVELLPAVDGVSALPDDFPSAAVPMPGGTVVEATREADGGWSLEVAVDGDDRLTRALELLPEVPGARPLDDTTTPVERPSTDGAWTVRVAPSQHPDGRDTLVYRLTPA